MTDAVNNKESEQISDYINSSDSIRHQWISVAAYFKAEARGFEQGKDLNNWLEAEIEYNDFQIQAYLLRCKEDGGLSICGLQKLAESIGIPNTKQLTTEIQLIRAIQIASRHLPCFQSTYQEPCVDSEFDCPWRKECQQLIAIWYR